jgi:hypothetical protein
MATDRLLLERWHPWREDATSDEKIDIMHRQADILRDHIRGLLQYVDGIDNQLQSGLKDTGGRLRSELQQLASDLRGERNQASRVDARGLGPIALGIILTGLPDELAAVAAVGWLAITGAILWTVAVSPSWLRDYRRALALSTD